MQSPHHLKTLVKPPKRDDLEDLSRAATFRLTIFTTTFLMLQQINICHRLGFSDTSRSTIRCWFVCLPIRPPGKRRLHLRVHWANYFHHGGDTREQQKERGKSIRGKKEVVAMYQNLWPKSRREKKYVKKNMKMFYPDFPPMRKMFGTKSTTVVVEPPGSAAADTPKKTCTISGPVAV